MGPVNTFERIGSWLWSQTALLPLATPTMIWVRGGGGGWSSFRNPPRLPAGFKPVACPDPHSNPASGHLGNKESPGGDTSCPTSRTIRCRRRARGAAFLSLDPAPPLLNLFHHLCRHSCSKLNEKVQKISAVELECAFAQPHRL